MIKKLDGKIFSELIKSGSNNLVNNKNKIDALNVFPVPDGDTGTNMSSTIKAASDKLNEINSKDLSEVSKIVSKNMLFGARGNSGVILSQIFKGFSLAFENKKNVDILELLEAFKKATEKAYSSVLKPVEGTILTVIRETTEQLEKHVDKKTTFEEFFKLANEFSRKACDNTPNKLKILREVGVTDSGGEGFCEIIKGMYLYTIDQFVEIKENENDPTEFIRNKEVYDGEFGFCTEFIIELTEKDDFDQKSFKKTLSRKANSLVIVQDNEILKVHAHTLKPIDILNLGQKYGEFLKIKSENMSKQASKRKNQNIILNNKEKEDQMDCGVVSCNLGSGIIKIMKEYGCDAIIESGQTQNPSAQDIIDAINSVNAKNVFVLPNNSNIFLAAKQAAQAINDKKVFIIPTKTQIQGINALINFTKDNSAKENQENMTEAIKLVLTGEVTQSVRTTKLNNIKIKKGQFIGICDSKIVTAKNSYIEAAKDLIKKTINKNHELITIYYGNDASETDANELLSFIQGQYDVNIEVVDGNQPNYHFIIGFE